MSQPDDDGLVPVTATRLRKIVDLDSPGPCDELDRRLSNQLCNDYGNAQRLVERFGTDLLYVKEVGWFGWNGSHWSREGGADAAGKAADQTQLAIWREVEALKQWPGKGDPSEKIGRLQRHANDSGNISSLNAMVKLAARYVSKPIDELDAHPFMLAVANGTVELSPHCEFRESRREDYLTSCCRVEWKTDGTCDAWLKFLTRIMPDEEMRDFLQRVLGYCLTGSTREQAFFLFHGTGQNGKSTLVNVLRAIMGDYAMVSPVTTFLAKREGASGSAASPDLARLPGARLVTSAEPPEGARLDEGSIKEITGGEPIAARHLNQGFFTFRPIFKAIISANHQPTIRGVDQGIWRRIRLVPFLVQISDDEIDRDLEAKLMTEAPAIFQWMLSGVEEWFVQGLNPPKEALAAAENYRADQDPAGEFLKYACTRTDSINPATGFVWETPAAQLYAAYREWCRAEGIYAMAPLTFGRKLTARGIGRRKSNGHRHYCGIMVKPTHQVTPDAGHVLADDDE